MQAALAPYVRLAREARFLSEPEERDLLQRARGGDLRATERVVRAFTPLVLKHALRLGRQYSFPADELLQDGMQGLLEAVQHFDPERGARFSTCALFWIRACSLRHVLGDWRLVRVGTTRLQREAFFNLQRERRLAERQGAPAQASALAARMGLPESELLELEQYLRNPEVSLDQLAPDGSSALELPCQELDRPDQAAERRELSARLVELLSSFRQSLSARDRLILDERWMTPSPAPHRELGEQLGLTSERVRQLEAALHQRFLIYARATLVEVARPRAAGG